MATVTEEPYTHNDPDDNRFIVKFSANPIFLSMIPNYNTQGARFGGNSDIGAGVTYVEIYANADSLKDRGRLSEGRFRAGTISLEDLEALATTIQYYVDRVKKERGLE